MKRAWDEGEGRATSSGPVNTPSMQSIICSVCQSVDSQKGAYGCMKSSYSPYPQACTIKDMTQKEEGMRKEEEEGGNNRLILEAPLGMLPPAFGTGMVQFLSLAECEIRWCCSVSILSFPLLAPGVSLRKSSVLQRSPRT